MMSNGRKAETGQKPVAEKKNEICGDVEPSVTTVCRRMSHLVFSLFSSLSLFSNMVILRWKSIATAVTVGFQLDVVNCFFPLCTILVVWFTVLVKQ